MVNKIYLNLSMLQNKQNSIRKKKIMKYKTVFKK